MITTGPHAHEPTRNGDRCRHCAAEINPLEQLTQLLMDQPSEAAVEAMVGELSEETLRALHAHLEPSCEHPR